MLSNISLNRNNYTSSNWLLNKNKSFASLRCFSTTIAKKYDMKNNQHFLLFYNDSNFEQNIAKSLVHTWYTVIFPDSVGFVRYMRILLAPNIYEFNWFSYNEAESFKARMLHTHNWHRSLCRIIFIGINKILSLGEE